VNGVSAGHFVRGQPTAKQILLANGAVAHVLARLAVVLVKEQRVDAHAAVVAVSKVFATSDATKATVRTVIRAFLAGHPEIANVAVVLSKLNAALDAVVAVAVNTREERSEK